MVEPLVQIRKDGVRQVARSLGLFNEKLGVSERANVLIDEQGKVSAIRVYPMKDLPSIEEFLEMVRDLDK